MRLLFLGIPLDPLCQDLSWSYLPRSYTLNMRTQCIHIINMSFELAYCPLPTLFPSHWEVSNTFETTCATIGSYISANDRNIWFSEIVPGGTNLSFPEGCWQQSQVVSQDICRITLSVSTSDMSEISLEVWLPRDWSGRFLSTANGGLSGCKCGRFYTLPRVCVIWCWLVAIRYSVRWYGLREWYVNPVHFTGKYLANLSLALGFATVGTNAVC